MCILRVFQAKSFVTYKTKIIFKISQEKFIKRVGNGKINCKNNENLTKMIKIVGNNIKWHIHTSMPICLSLYAITGYIKPQVNNTRFQDVHVHNTWKIGLFKGRKLTRTL